MIEREPLLRDLPKGAPERIAVAKRIREMRNADRNPNDYEYTIDRDGNWYLAELMGLEHFLNYVRALKRRNLVLDLGAGTTRGVWDLSRSFIGKGLDFRATVLSDHQNINHFLGRPRTIYTSAETLRGIRDESIAGILALHSITYSIAPALTIRSLDRVLVPGGAIKATFVSPDHGDRLAKPHPWFSEELKKLGYDTWWIYSFLSTINIAIKPGGLTQITAKALLEADSTTWQAQSCRRFDFFRTLRLLIP